jgi:hypothetical protein
VLELAGNVASERNKTNIGVHDIRAAIANDEEIVKLIDYLAMYHKQKLPFMFPELDTEFADDLEETVESVGAFKYAHWGRNQHSRTDSVDDEQGPPAADELAREGAFDDDESDHVSDASIDIELSDDLQEFEESVGAFNYAHWGRDQDARTDSSDDEQEPPDDDELAREGAFEDDDSDGGSNAWKTYYESRIFLTTHIKPLILRRGVATSLEYLDHMHPLIGVTEQGMATMNMILNLVLNAIASFAFYRAAKFRETILTPSAIECAVDAVLPVMLATHAVSEGTKAVTNLELSMDEFSEESARIPNPLFHRRLNAAFAAFTPEPVAHTAGRSFLVAIHPRLRSRVLSRGHGRRLRRRCDESCSRGFRRFTLSRVRTRVGQGFQLSPWLKRNDAGARRRTHSRFVWHRRELPG